MPESDTFSAQSNDPVSTPLIPAAKMPLSNGYGALVGTVTNYWPDNPDAAGRYYHVNLSITTQNGLYRCAIDVDSHQANTGVEWRILQLSESEVSALQQYLPGWHSLQSTPLSGAMDYVRSPAFRIRAGCAAFVARLLGRKFDISESWKRGSSLDAVADFAPLATKTQSAGLRAIVFGEPFTTGLGVHNVHQNQGDPLGSAWSAENGIWQDGLTVLQQTESEYVVFMNKFTSQSYLTDDFGHPA